MTFQILISRHNYVFSMNPQFFIPCAWGMETTLFTLMQAQQSSQSTQCLHWPFIQRRYNATIFIIRSIIYIKFNGMIVEGHLDLFRWFTCLKIANWRTCHPISIQWLIQHTGLCCGHERISQSFLLEDQVLLQWYILHRLFITIVRLMRFLKISVVFFVIKAQ